MTDPKAEPPNSDPTHEPAPAALSSSRRRRWFLLFGIASFLAVVAVVEWPQRPIDPLPRADEIESMRTSLENPHKGVLEYEVPARHYPRIRSTLSPTRIDREPAKCIGMGRLKIKTRKGREVGVSLYNSDYEVEGTYYHYPDGKYGAIEDAIRAAHADAAREQP